MFLREPDREKAKEQAIREGVPMSEEMEYAFDGMSEAIGILSRTEREKARKEGLLQGIQQGRAESAKAMAEKDRRIRELEVLLAFRGIKETV